MSFKRENLEDGGQFHAGQITNPPHPQDVPGITRRDWLAGLAMQGIVGGDPKDLTKREGLSFVEASAELAYQAADAMIKEGNK